MGAQMPPFFFSGFYGFSIAFLRISCKVVYDTKGVHTMSTITLARRRKANTTDWRAYREQRAYLADLFAVIAYSGQPKRPLALGIKADLIEASTYLSAAEIKHFLRAYTFGPKYLRGLKAGAQRYALDGAVDGLVSEQEAAYARLCLDTHYREKKRARERRAVVPVTLVAVRLYAEAA